MREQPAAGSIYARPIVEPELPRTLQICRLADRQATYAVKAMRALLIELVSGVVVPGSWPARLLCPSRSGPEGAD